MKYLFSFSGTFLTVFLPAIFVSLLSHAKLDFKTVECEYFETSKNGEFINTGFEKFRRATNTIEGSLYKVRFDLAEPGEEELKDYLTVLYRIVDKKTDRNVVRSSFDVFKFKKEVFFNGRDESHVVFTCKNVVDWSKRF